MVDVLEAVFTQHVAFDFEVVVVDSGSSPQELASMRGFPVRLHQIPAATFGHGRTRNLLAERSEGEVLLFLSQDAEPATTDWMERLVTSLTANVAGSYARQLPRPDADPLIRFFLQSLYGPAPARRRLPPSGKPQLRDMFFSNVSSAMRREVWHAVPFRDDVVMSEDQYWAYDALRAGYEVVYEPAACVYHSHNYTLQTLFQRNRLSGASLRGLMADSPRDVVARGMRYVLGEAGFLIAERSFAWLPYMLAYEATKSVGFALGSLFGQPTQRIATTAYSPAD